MKIYYIQSKFLNAPMYLCRQGDTGDQYFVTEWSKAYHFVNFDDAKNTSDMFPGSTVETLVDGKEADSIVTEKVEPVKTKRRAIRRTDA